MARRTSGTAPNGNHAKAQETAPVALSHGQVAERAYFKWTERGRPAGEGLEDWLDASEELRNECAARAIPGQTK